MSKPKNRFSEQLAQATEDEPEGEGTENDEPEEKPARRARGSSETRADPPPRRNAAPKAGKPKARQADDAVSISITVDGVTFAVPQGSPLHKRALAVAEALFAD